MPFFNASKVAYGAVSYLRTQYDQVSCRLIAVKSKVAPLNPTTIPRLELMAAVLGLMLAQFIHKVMCLPIQGQASSPTEKMCYGGFGDKNKISDRLWQIVWAKFKLAVATRVHRKEPSRYLQPRCQSNATS